jgi:cytochrome c
MFCDYGLFRNEATLLEGSISILLQKLNACRRIFVILAIGVASLATFGNSIAQAAGAGDPARGARLYGERCTACHALDEDRIGPHHRGVVGRKAGGAAGYDYSAALAGASFIWTAMSLDAWLADPQALVPGQRMEANVLDPQDRADLIAYLTSLKP